MGGPTSTGHTTARDLLQQLLHTIISCSSAAAELTVLEISYDRRNTCGHILKLLRGRQGNQSHNVN
jgi:hypothetical protein